jgi:hypothetical protein
LRRGHLHPVDAGARNQADASQNTQQQKQNPNQVTIQSGNSLAEFEDWFQNEKAFEVFPIRAFSKGLTKAATGSHPCSLAMRAFFDATFMATIVRFNAKNTLHFLLFIIQKLRSGVICKIVKIFSRRKLQTFGVRKVWGVHPMAGKGNSNYTIHDSVLIWDLITILL